MRDSGLFDVSDRLTYRWVRETTVDQWLAHNGSHSYISSLREPDRVALLADAKTVKHHFPGQMQVPYETWLWIATKRYDPTRSKTMTLNGIGVADVLTAIAFLPA